MGMNLFDGDDDDIEKLDNIEINEEFARRYEHNKKREDLQKLEELKKKGVIDDESNTSSEDEDEEEEEEVEDLNGSSNLKFFDGLLKIKKGDPVVLNNKLAKLFDSDDETETETNPEKNKENKKKKKPMYLKDVVSKHLIEEGPEFGNDEEEEEEKEEKKVKTYNEEQDELRKEFLNAVKEDEEEDEDLFKVKEIEKDDNVKEGDTEFVKKLDEFFGEDDKLDEETVFLKDFFRKEMWKEDKKGKRDDVEDVELISEDEEEIERQEDYEREFNFRYEENAGDRVWGHSRKVEGSVRKKTNARKLQRDRKEERIAQAEEERKEELKRLKNLKKKEMKEKLEKIKETAGIGDDEDCLLDVDDLEEEFDPDEYDRKMKKAFGDAYYDADDIDPEFGSDEDEGVEKPDFDKEDELLGLPKGWDNVDEPRDGFLSTRERLLKTIENEGNEGDHDQTTDDNKGSADEEEEGKRKKKRKRSNTVMKAVREELMEEYYKLDYEDTIGDLKTRFKYRPVKANRFGLAPAEMLMIEDKEFNQYVSLKKIAPYREKEWKVPRIKAYELKQDLKGGVSHVPKSDKKKAKFGNKEKIESETDDRKRKQEESNGDTSKRSRKRKKQAEHNLSTSRLNAYSANPSVSNSKKK